MKKLTELRNKRASQIEEMQTIVARMENEKDENKKNSDQTKWNELNKSVESLDNEIKLIERQDELNKSIVSAKSNENEEIKAAKRYDLFKAIREARNGKLTGLELEMHQEAEKEYRNSNAGIDTLGIPSMIMRADVTTTNQSTHVGNKVDGLSIIKTPSLIEKLGLTIYDNIQGGKLTLPYTDQVDANFIDAGGSFAEYSIGNNALALAARSVGGYKSYSKDYLAQTSQSMQNAMLQDFNDSIWRAVQKDLFSEVGSLAEMAAYSGTTLSGITQKLFVDMESEIEAMDNASYVMTRPVMGKAKSTPKGSGDLMIMENNEINGYNAYGTNLVSNAGHIYFGNWKYGVIGRFGSGAISLLIDPFSNKATDKIDIQASALYDTGIINPNGFSVIKLA